MKLVSKTYPYLDSACLFSGIADEPWAMFLDSGLLTPTHKPKKNSRYDILACRPMTTLVTQSEETIIERLSIQRHKDKIEKSKDDPILLLQKELPSVEQDTGYPYGCGAIGYFSYDLGRRFESIPELAEDDERLPEMAMGIYNVVVVVDHVDQQTQLIRLEGESSQELFEFWQGEIKSQLSMINHFSRIKSWLKQSFFSRQKLISAEIKENLDYSNYVERFNKVKDYIHAGDCYQVNLAKRFSASVLGDAWQTYRYLRETSPAPYGAYFNLPFAQVLSNSPESFIRCHQGNVITSPIKGTMPRDHDNAKNDQRIAEDLYNSKKDRAENLMIVDLMRNDLSRCCELGSVKVPKLFEVHSFTNVHHLISKITGKLKTGFNSLDLVRSCFPGGSITGAPKIRAMQIIEELEPHRRGLYCGSIGYIGMNGSMETNIAIRTIVVKDGQARFSAGGGLVFDSDVESEYQEVIDKARMMRSALSD